MIVTYAPSEGERREWEYKSADLPSGEAEDIEDAIGSTFVEWQTSLLQGGAKARRALLWVLLKRDNSSLKFGDVSFRLGELSVEFDREEKQQVRAELEKSTDLSEQAKAQALRVLADDEDGRDEQGGKDRSTRDSPTDTSG